MKSISGKEFARILEQHGWELVRIQGSHHIFRKQGIRTAISLPIHGKEDLKAGLLKFFLKAADLTESDL